MQSTEPTPRSLTRSPDFLRLWGAETFSVFGAQVTQLALPITAAVVLGATAAQMGLLTALATLPFALFGLLAGAWVDRVQRRPILIWADVMRGVVLLAVPVAALLGALRIEVLYVTGFLVATLTVFFDVAYQSYLPSLVRRDQLVDGNAKLESSRALSQIAGPGVAGALVQALGAPVAVLVNAVTYLVSAAFLRGIQAREAQPQAPGGQRSLPREIGEGLKVVFGSRVLRSIAGCTATSNLFGSAGVAVFILFVTRELNFTPATLGIIFGLASAGALAGALLAGRIATRFGVGPTIVGASVLFPLGALLIPLAPVPGAQVPALLAAAVLVAGQLIVSFASLVYNITQVSLRQAITPHRLLGRMNATMRFVVWGVMPIGALIGGLLGETLGLRETLWISAAGQGLAFLWVLLSPVRSMQTYPTDED